MHGTSDERFSAQWNAQVEASMDAVAVGVEELSTGTIIVVETADGGTYGFKVVDPECLKVTVVCGDDVVVPGMTGYLQGSSLTPYGTLRRGWVAVGYFLNFGSEELPFLPSFVELAKTVELYVNGTRLAHSDGTVTN